MDAKLVCDLLQSEGIPARFNWEGLLEGIPPRIDWDTGEGDLASVWIVEDSDFERALRFVEEFSRLSSGKQKAAIWPCSTCGEIIEAQFETCWKCAVPEVEPDDDISPAESDQAVSETNVGAQEQTGRLWMLVRLLGGFFLLLGFIGFRESFSGPDSSWLSIVFPYFVVAGFLLLAFGSR